MRTVLEKSLLILCLATGLAACGGGNPDLLNFAGSQSGPDEFSILPNKPLEKPDNMAQLPPPTPGGSNLVDPTPKADAVAALGGKPDRLNRGANAGESAVIAHASRHGVAGDIRAVLAAEDRAWRDEHRPRLLERMFNVSTYFRAYEAMELDQYAELERLRARGIWTPTVPPEWAVAAKAR
ncbi:MAG: pyruvate/2-oxoglutarate dehydrogenase complex, dihydrolipoamide acyltransferase (E2) component [Rhodobacterales bacterium]|nr:MAG: pyruvate/2-oxoglutarate dehydrogenase complex, dihydrolipoamide acyltransferase (E2) component [Rhodobacterales bacterium]